MHCGRNTAKKHNQLSYVGTEPMTIETEQAATTKKRNKNTVSTSSKRAVMN